MRMPNVTLVNVDDVGEERNRTLVHTLPIVPGAEQSTNVVEPYVVIRRQMERGVTMSRDSVTPAIDSHWALPDAMVMLALVDWAFTRPPMRAMCTYAEHTGSLNVNVTLELVVERTTILREGWSVGDVDVLLMP